MLRSTGARPGRRCFPRSGSRATPIETLLEENDLAVLLRSDHLDHIADGAKSLFDKLDLFDVTSIRKGFAGGGFEGGRSLPKEMALAAGVPGAELIPDTAELFLGFTSTQSQGLGPRKIVNFETLGYVDLRSGYFREGTHMHLSHLNEELDTWYQLFDFDERVDTIFRPGLDVPEGTQTVPQAPADVASRAQIAHGLRTDQTVGHSAAIQTASRLQADHVAGDGTVYRKGTAIPHRADFNTLDNPFFWSVDPILDKMSDQASAGVHFVVFNPSSDDFKRMRNAMDGVVPRRRTGRSSSARPRSGDQLGAANDAPAELPRAAAPPSRVSARRDLAEERFGDVVPLGRHRLQLGGRLRSETSTIESPCSAAIRPHEPARTRSAAFRP